MEARQYGTGAVWQAGQVAESSEIKERYCVVQISMLFRFWNNMEVLRAGGSERGGRFDRRGQGVTSSVGLFTNTTSEWNTVSSCE